MTGESQDPKDSMRGRKAGVVAMITLAIIGAVGAVVFLAPIATLSIKVEMPPPPMGSESPAILLKVSAGPTVKVNDQASSIETLAADVRKAAGGQADPQILIRADVGVPYTEFMVLSAALRDAEFTKVALVGEDL